MAATYQHEYNGKVIAIRETDGFVDATALCAAGEREFTQWHMLESTVEVIETLQDEVKRNVIEAIVDEIGLQVWIHPRLATCVAYWIDPLLSMKLSGWLDLWRAKKAVQKRLQQELGGSIEEETPVGFIDLLTDDEIVEIEEISMWKESMGELLCYAKFHPTKRKRLHLFNSSTCNQKDIIERICCKYDITVTYE